jgi:hypothetical protein
MAKLRLGALVDEKPVKLMVELPAPVHRDLLAYAALHAAENTLDTAQPDKLVAPMLAMFMADDREFMKMRRAGGGPGS